MTEINQSVIKEGKFPKSKRLRLKARMIYLKAAIIAITRNKRRSVSMIAGLILGVSILSGILLYSTVVMNNVYDTVIEGSPYEVRMDLKEPFNNSQFEDFRLDFISNPKVLDAQLLYGNARTIFENTGPRQSFQTLANLEAELVVQYSNQTFGNAESILFSETFLSSNEIGNRFKEKLVTSQETGIYSNVSSNFHGAILSEEFAEKAHLQQGNLLSSVTLAVTKQDPDEFFSRTTVTSVKISNITVAGIISSDIGATAGLFSEALNFGSEGTIYIPEEVFVDQNKTDFLNDLNTNEMKYAVLKINEELFNLADPSQTNSQINQLVNEIEKRSNVFIGTNLVEGQLIPFQALSVFIFIFDGILTIPVAILSLYLLSFGIDLSLHERKYQVGILKTQGASPSQIKRKVLMETFLLAAAGLIIGYIVAIFAAWGIGTAKGFMKWDWDYALSKLPEFFQFDEVAFFVVGGLIILILFFMVNGKANAFIEMEIIESVRRTEKKQQNFLRRNNLDLILFGIGSLVLLLVLADQWFDLYIDLGFVGGLLAILGPPFFWIGGAALVARVAVWLPPKTDSIIRRIGFLSDVAILVKGNVFRKAGNMPRLSLIIALTVSFSILAAVQGTTGEIHKERLIIYDVGTDIKVSTSINFSMSAIRDIKSSSTDIVDVMALGVTSGMILNDIVTIHSVDSTIYDSVGIWQSDSTPDSTPFDLMQGLENDLDGVLLGNSILQEQALEVGEKFTLDILSYQWNGSFVNYEFIPFNVTVRGVFDHTPGGVSSTGVIIDHALINKISNLTALADTVETLSPFITSLIPNFIFEQLESVTENPKEILATEYFVKIQEGANPASIKSLIASVDNPWVISVKTLETELREANEIQNVDYGIPGLLTADFVISLLAATLATFIFMSILMEQRKKEFAILRSYGTSDRQIYKIVFSESIVLLLTSVLWGLMIGIGLSVLFNGFFEFIDVFLTPLSALTSGGGSLSRIIIFDLAGLLGTLFITLIAMLIATYFSVRGSAKAKISTVVREL
ncbi:MAG: ABC transporter permease [Candidatus Hodarchaeales archaeon]